VVRQIGQRWFVAMAPRTLTGLAASSLLLLAAVPAANEPSWSLASGTQTFSISGTVHAAASMTFPAAACVGPAAPLAPGVTRCLVYRVENYLDVPITVRTMSMSLDPSYPPPPSGCSSGELDLPAFAGTLTVPGLGSALSPGLPVTLKDTPLNQDGCKQTVLHFVFTGTADKTETTGSLAFTGADPIREALFGLALSLWGVALVLAARRARRRTGESP
jgi:hypothetical protein